MGNLYLSQEIGRQVLVDAECSFLLGDAGESDGGRDLEERGEGQYNAIREAVAIRFFALTMELVATGTRTLEALRAEATARLRPNLNMAAAVGIEGGREEQELKSHERRFERQGEKGEREKERRGSRQRRVL